MAQGSVFKRCSCTNATGRRIGARCPQLRRPDGRWNLHHGRWGYQLELPHTPTGARRQLRRIGFDTRDAAATEHAQAKDLLRLAGGDHTAAVEIATLLTQVKTGQPLPDRDFIARRLRAGIPASSGTPLGDYLWQWYASRKIRPTTLVSYESIIRNHLQPHLGHIPIDQLRPGHVQAMFDTLANPPTPGDDGGSEIEGGQRRAMTGATMHRVRAVLRKALNDAIRRQLIDRNPATHIELPSGKRPKARVWNTANVRTWQATGKRPSPVMVWTPAQAGAFLDYAETHDIMLYPLLALILHRGLRRGEAVGLRDTDIDLDTGVMTITQQMTTVGHKPTISAVKTDAGDRTIPLDTATTAILRTHRARRARWQLVTGPEWPDTGLLFVQPDGHPWHPNTVSHRFNELITTAGLPPIRLHDLRHCAATYLKATGADLKDIQETLGHSSIAITADTYTSVIHELHAERAKADAASALVPRAPRRAS